MSRIQKACQRYQGWKKDNNPHFKPWIYPEQMNLPRLNLQDIHDMAECRSYESIDESGVLEDIAQQEIDDNNIW